MMLRRLITLCALVAALGAVAAAQAKRPGAAQAPPPAPVTPPQDLPTPPPDFTYSTEGRRDPFLNLGRRGSTVAVAEGTARPSGAAGLLVDELAVRGIVRSEGAYVAMVSGPSGQTFIIRPGARLYDGTVKSIAADAITIVQQVTDPLSLQKQREVRKPLRVQQEEGK